MTLTHRLPDLVLTDHVFHIPLDHARPERGSVPVYAREVRAPEKENEDLPWLVFLQGGPGCPSPRPNANTGWIKRATQEFRVLLLDQRGTGRSTPATYQTLAGLGDARAQADYLKHFRADAIVRDAEWIRRELAGADVKWTVLGQSFGGFCLAHYLSSAPEGLAGAVFTGGIPKLDAHVDDIYRETYPLCAMKNERYYERYPSDIDVVRDIVEHLGENDVRLPNGDRLSPRRFQQLGLSLGMSDGFELMHYLFEEAFVNDGTKIGFTFLRGFQNALHFDTNPLFAILHEACYAQGFATRWSAERLRAEFPRFDIEDGKPVTFTGEMIYPWMFDEISELAPLKDAAQILAENEDWPALYDADVLARNTVPAAAVIYSNDMYVPRTFSEETAAQIAGLRTWVTDEYEHNGLRADGENVLGKLLEMLRS